MTLAAGIKRLLEPLRPWAYRAHERMIIWADIVCFFTLHRKFREPADQRSLWEGRSELDFKVIAEIEADPYYQRLDAAMMERIAASDEPEILLEIGSHIGYRLQKFARRFPSKHFIGIDLGLENILFGKQHLPQSANTTLVNGTATALPFATASIDVVYTCVCLTHVNFDLIGQALNEVTRVGRRRIILWEVDHRPMDWRRRLTLPGWSYGYLHPYEKLVSGGFHLKSATPMPDDSGHLRYTIFEFEKAV
jgi:hypothetical protein